MLNQFSRTQLLLGPDTMESLYSKKVAVFGIRKPDNTLAGITDLFKRYSPEVSIIKVNENAWAFYFSDENIDPYVYYIEQNVFGLEYHRFTRESYNKMMSEAGK